MAKKGKVKNQYTFDEQPLIRFANFLQKIRYIDTEKAGDLGFELDEYQWDILREVLGCKKANGLRRFKRCALALPRKQGKTTFVILLCLFLLLVDEEPRPLIILAAVDKDQANIALQMAKDYIQASPWLSKRIIEKQNELLSPSNNGRLMIVSSEGLKLHGFNPSAIILDELHGWVKARAQEAFDALTTSQHARQQPLLFMISTAGTDTNTIWFRELQYARDILAGKKKNDSYFAFIREADPSDDWTDPKVWHKVNPALGKHIALDTFEQLCQEAKDRPEKQNAFKRLYLNLWTTAETSFIAINKWLKLKETEITIEDLHGLDMYVGIDLSATKDLTAIVGCVVKDDLFYLIPYGFTPAAYLLEHEQRDQQPYSQWVESGHLIATPGPIVDQRVLRDYIDILAKDFKIKDIAFDIALASQLMLELNERKFPVSKFKQDYSWMHTATTDFESAILTDRIRHFDNKVLNWCIENLAITRETSTDRIRPSKRLSKQRIDLAIAAIMAHDKANRARIQQSVKSTSRKKSSVRDFMIF